MLLCTDELSDLVLCDRVVVFVRGEVFTEFGRPPFDRDELIVATEGLSMTREGPVAEGHRRGGHCRRVGRSPRGYNPAEEAAQ